MRSAKLVHPERRVVAVSGDGGCKLIQWKQRARLGRESGVAFTNPDFVALAHAFGVRGVRVESARELGPRLGHLVSPV